METIFAILLLLNAQCASPETDEFTRRLGYELLKLRMIEYEHRRSVDWTPPGYFIVGYVVRVG